VRDNPQTTARISSGHPLGATAGQGLGPACTIPGRTRGRAKGILEAGYGPENSGRCLRPGRVDGQGCYDGATVKPLRLCS
jgi:hypothetical protein